MKAVIVDSMLSQIRQAERQVAKAAGVGPIDQQMAFAEGMREHFASQQLPLPSQAVLWIMEPSPDRHNAVADVLVGKATLIESLLPAHMAESARKPRQEADCERAVRKLVAYLVNHDKPTTTEHLTRRMVGEWVSERVKLDHHWKTINKDLSFCSGLFKHAIRRGITELNPFSLQSLPKRRIKTKRAYTKAEVRTLLRGRGDPWLIDSIRILALSGMRADELAKLRVRNCKNGIFQLLDTKHGNRNVPIHNELRKLIRRRSLNKAPEEFLFQEYPTPTNPRIERSQFLSKHFARYRRKLGLDEPNGRQSAIDLHSLRRYFITQADAAGHRKEDIERVVGHQPQSLSLGLYADPMSIRQMRRVVESVRI